MNQALAEWEAANNYARPLDVESAANILAERGFNSDNWVCLTANYKVYWDKEKNRMVLYNSSTAEVEYPEDYEAKDLLNNQGRFFVYNANQIIAQAVNLKLGSSSSAVTAANLVSQAQSINGGAELSSTAAANLTAIQTILSDSTKRKAVFGSSDAINVYATQEKVVAVPGSSNVKVSMQVSSVGTAANAAAQFQNAGEAKPNMFYISVSGLENATTEEKQLASAEVGNNIYTVFSQITTGKLDSDLEIVLAPGTQIDVSACEWAPCKTFTGYFGTTDSGDPIVINGARLTENTGYSQTYSIKGGNSKHFLTGFFGAIYGTTTIENVKFKNLTIENPGIDYSITENQATRNTVGIIGGITPVDGKPVDVIIRNVIVESSCSITGAGTVGGLVGVLHNSDAADLTGSVLIENCIVSATVASSDSVYIASGTGYSPVGGILGNANGCSTNPTTGNFQIKNCTMNGTVSGYGDVGGIVGGCQKSYLKVDSCNPYSATLRSAGLCTAIFKCGSTQTNSTTANGSNYWGYDAATNDMYSASKPAMGLDFTRIGYFFGSYGKGATGSYEIVSTFKNGETTVAGDFPIVGRCSAGMMKINGVTQTIADKKPITYSTRTTN